MNGLYQVSNLGRVKSLNYNHTKEEKILRQSLTGDNYYHTRYYRVSLYKNNITKYYRVHRLVAETFIDNPNDLPYVNHKDWNTFNNNVNNLEWCTPKYNSNHKRNNRKPLGE